MIFDWIARVTKEHRNKVITIFALLTAIAAYQGSKLRFEGDVSSLLPEEDTRLYREIIDQVGSQADLVILLEGEDPEQLALAAEKFRSTMAKHPNVKSVTYRPKMEGPLPQEYAPRLSPAEMTQRLIVVREKLKKGLIDIAVKEDPLGIKEDLAREARKRFSGFRFDLSDGMLYAPNRKAILVIIAGHKKPHDLEAARSTYDLATSISVPVRVSMTGGYAVAVVMQETIRSDFFNTGIFSIVGVTLMFLFGFRRLRAIPFAAIPIGVGTILTLGLTQMIYERLTPITIVFAPMLVGLGIDFPIHFYNRWRAEGDIRKAIAGFGPSVFAAALTTSAVLWCLAPSRLNAYRELGVIAGCGVLLTLAATLFLCPIIGSKVKNIQAPRFNITRLGSQVFPLLILFTLAMTVFASKGIRFQGDAANWVGHAPVFQTQVRIANLFEGTLETVFFLSRSEKEAEELKPKLEQLVDEGVFSGVAPAYPPLRSPTFQTDFANALSNAGFRKGAFTDYSDWIQERLQADAPKLLVSVGMLKERVREREHREKIHTQISEATGIEFTGGTVLTQSLDNTFREDAQRATLHAAIAILFITLILLRKIHHTFFALIPVIFGAIWTLGIMNLIQIQVDPLSVTVFMLMGGISIDHGIHMVSRAKQIGGEHASAELFRPIVLTSGTSLIGFGSLITATHPMVHSFGTTVMIGISAGLFATILILPVLLAKAFPRKTG